MQIVVVALLVAGCAVYAAWTLMPAAARRALSVVLLNRGWTWPAAIATTLRKAAKPASGCGCDGCDRAPKAAKAAPAKAAAASPTGAPPPPVAQPIKFHPRVRH